ncbi:MAG: rod shape-determining protein MreC [Cyanobacteriota bacterium]|jgi:rod shape-determining protein MreC
MNGRSSRVPTLRKIADAWPWWLLVLALMGVRLSKGAFFADAYALLSRPFWPGSAQAEWLRSARTVADQARLSDLERDNRRLRQMLQLDRSGGDRLVSAAVISRQPGGWWQQLELGKGRVDGIAAGDAVLAPGGLIGRVASVTPTTARVLLLTDSSSRLGVWVGRTRQHALLQGLGTSRPRLEFLEKDPGVRPGDIVSTSPASTLLPPNITVGVVQSIDEQAVPAPDGLLQLSAPVDAVDWVQVVTR